MTGALQAQDDSPAAEKPQPDRIVAEFKNKRVELRLEMNGADRFSFWFKRSNKPRPQIHSTKPLEARSSYHYKFVRKRELNEAGDRCTLYEFEQVGRPSYDLYIWTNIKAVSESNLDHMYIDRVPYCIVQMINPAGIFPAPLNRVGAPAAEHFQAAGPIPFKKDKKYGYMDKSRKTVLIDARFDRAGRFKHGRAKVKLDGKTGFIDEAGKYIVEPRFGWSTDFGKHGEPNLALVTLDEKVGMIDRTGKMVIAPKYDSMSARFSGGVIEVRIGDRHGIVDRTGKVVIKPIYESVRPYSEGFAAVQHRGKFGFLDKTGKFAIEPQYVTAGPFVGGLAPVELDSGKWGFINPAAEMKLPAVYDRAWIFEEGLAAVAINKKIAGQEHAVLRWGFIDDTGKIVVPYRFERVSVFQDGKCYAVLDGKVGTIDKDGRFEARASR